MDYLDWQDRWEKLVEKSLDKGYESLSADERIWYNVRTLIDAADNGGLISFYYNYGADHLDETVSDLKHIGSSEVIHIIEQINALFPKALPPRNIDKRNESINSWDNKNDLILESWFGCQKHSRKAAEKPRQIYFNMIK